jgi:predicted pyridoxine 5'-phosphate oxidase superfamily flavin-nucleotide-binding protein
VFPDVVQQAWEDHQGPIVLATVGADGWPNAVYVSGVREFGDDTLTIADNYLHMTRANILAASKGCAFPTFPT